MSSGLTLQALAAFAVIGGDAGTAAAVAPRLERHRAARGAAEAFEDSAAGTKLEISRAPIFDLAFVSNRTS